MGLGCTMYFISLACFFTFRLYANLLAIQTLESETVHARNTRRLQCTSNYTLVCNSTYFSGKRNEYQILYSSWPLIVFHSQYMIKCKTFRCEWPKKNRLKLTCRCIFKVEIIFQLILLMQRVLFFVSTTF